MIYTKGKRGKSKAEVLLSVDTVMGVVALHVWEKGKITHTFWPEADFMQAMVTHAQRRLNRMEAK